MGGGHEHHAPFGNSAGSLRFELGADLVDHDHLRHVVFHRLDHHLVLQFRPGHLHAPRPTNRGVRDVSIAGDLIAGVNHHNPLAQLVGQHASDFPQSRGFAHTRPAHQQQRLTTVEQIPNNRHSAKHSTADSAGEAHHITATVANRTDAMQGALNPGSIVSPELTKTFNSGQQLLATEAGIPKGHGAAWVTGLRNPPQIQDHLQQLIPAGRRFQRHLQRSRQQSQQAIEIVGDAFRGHRQAQRPPGTNVALTAF